MEINRLAILILHALLFSACALQSTLGAAVTEASSGKFTPLKDAKLNIEHNATDKDTGFQGFVDGEGWQSLTISGPDGEVLKVNGQGKLGNLGLTELFFETVEPANADIPITDMLAMFPEGDYTISGPAIEAAESMGQTAGVAWLTHIIPAGPALLSPEADAVVSAGEGLGVCLDDIVQESLYYLALCYQELALGDWAKDSLTTLSQRYPDNKFLAQSQKLMARINRHPSEPTTVASPITPIGSTATTANAAQPQAPAIPTATVSTPAFR